MTPIYFTPAGSQSFDEAVPQGIPRIETPFQELNRNAYVITQRYMQRFSAYKQPAENERMPRDVALDLGVVAYFVGDGPRTPTGVADIITFERSWATKPSQIIDTANPITVTVTKPNQWTLKYVYNWTTPTTGLSITTRLTNLGIAIAGVTQSFTAYVQRDFFLVGSSGDYATTSLIPSRSETVKSYKDWSSFPVNVEFTSSKWDSAVNSLPTQNVKLLSGFQSLGASFFAPSTTGSSGTSSAEYTGPALAAGTYVYGDSELTRYIGNIWERRSVNVTIT